MTTKHSTNTKAHMFSASKYIKEIENNEIKKEKKLQWRASILTIRRTTKLKFENALHET